MSRALIAIAAGVLLQGAAADPADRVMAERLSGLWSTEIHGDGYYVYGEVRYREDGYSAGRGLRVAGGRLRHIEFEGTWRIEDDMLIFSREESNGVSLVPESRVYRDRIELLTQDKLVLISESGERSIRYRLDYSRLFPR